MYSSFIAVIAEIGYRLQDKPVDVDRKGQAHLSGIFGTYLESHDALRMARLHEKFSRTAHGAEILAYAKEQGVDWSFSRRFAPTMLGEAAYDPTLPGKCYQIALNPAFSDDMLLGTIAHEVKHIRQYESMGAELLKRPHAAPADQIAVLRYMEADACSFQQKYLEDYAAGTGNAKPLNAFLKANIPSSFEVRTGLGDANRFAYWAAIIRDKGVYDEKKVEDIKSEYGAVYGPFATPSEVLSPDISAAMRMRLADQATRPMPHEGGAGCLSKFTPVQIRALGDVSPKVKTEADGLAAIYKSKFFRQSMASPDLSFKRVVQKPSVLRR